MALSADILGVIFGPVLDRVALNSTNLPTISPEASINDALDKLFTVSAALASTITA